MIEQAYHILVVDDDADIRGMLIDYLSPHGYHLSEAANGLELRARLAERIPHLVLLDVGLPGEDGLSLARSLRASHDIGIIMVSGAGDTIDRIIGLEVGADDYVSKPFDPRELLARIKSVLRRQQPQTTTGAQTACVDLGRCRLNLATRELLDDAGVEIPLTAMEFELLEVFCARPNRPLSRDQLLNLTQNRDWDPNDRSIDIRIARLRRKIEDDPDRPRILKTVRGIGYMFTPR